VETFVHDDGVVDVVHGWAGGLQRFHGQLPCLPLISLFAPFDFNEVVVFSIMIMMMATILMLLGVLGTFLKILLLMYRETLVLNREDISLPELMVYSAELANLQAKAARYLVTAAWALLLGLSVLGLNVLWPAYID